MTRRLHASPEVITPAPEQPVPLRKQLKDEAKKAKKQGKKKPKGDSQTVDGWELTVGIEIHAQLNTARKLFSPAVTSFNDEPNSHVALFDLAMPGSQPLFQKETLIPALRAALALNCEVQEVSRFDRKHYFWWDQPSGYQITQYYEPFAKNGHIALLARDGISPQDGESVTIGIKQVQLEQDTAKTLAQADKVQWLDFNRVGVPLIEIITEPELHHPRTAAVLVRKIQMLLNAVDACVSGMETGGLRADVNVSVRRTDGSNLSLGTRTEIKNLSTIKAVEDAIIAERDRQIRELEAGRSIPSETRGWSIGSTETRRLRGKEGEVDYRYMPDPDIAPLVIGNDLIDHLRQSLAVTPDSELDTLIARFGLTAKDALSLINLENGSRVQYYYKVLHSIQDKLSEDFSQAEMPEFKSYSALVGNWIIHELGRLTTYKAGPLAIRDLTFTPEGDCEQVPDSDLSQLLYHLIRKQITGKVAKELLFAIYLKEIEGGVTQAIAENDLWFKEIPEEEYEQLADEAMEGEHKILQEFASSETFPQGKLMFLVGKMMRLGPTERIVPANAERVMRAKVEADVTVPSHEDRDVPRTWQSSHGSTFKTVVHSNRDSESGVMTETVWETMNPYSSDPDGIPNTIPTASSTTITATPVATTNNYTTYSTATPAGNQSSGSGASTLHPPSGLSYGAIAAIVIGVLFGLAITALATWLLVRKSRRRSRVTQVTPPQTPIYSPSPPSSPLPTPPPLTESGNDRMSSLEDSWVSYGDRVRSPTPQPAVAEIRSFTRAWQKPRAYTVSRGRMTEVHGSEDSESPPSPDDDTSPISPLSRSSSVQADRRVVSPVSLVSRFSTMSNRTDQSRERAESQRKAF
ncbi:hypothetical protein LB506_004198 [Fusarium annulatum]|nr:hypothetical protein LB506_004198 [Fusarium annulatum]